MIHEEIATRKPLTHHITQEEIWLLGQPPLRRYLNFVEDMVVCGEEMDRGALTDEWRAANDYYEQLEQSERGIAEACECRELPGHLRPLAEEVMADVRYTQTFDALPARFAMVELDRLVVFQPHVTGDFVDALKLRLGPQPDEESLFRFCLPLKEPEAPVRIQRVGSKRYLFRSDSTDFRFHRSVLLQPDQLRDFTTFGPIAGVVALVVGFGSNFLNVIHGETRYLLHNGYHRACALRALGITHAPCIIQEVTRLDELEITAKRQIAEDSALYFKSIRPPLLKDFFDPKIRKMLKVRKVERIVEVNFEVKDFLVPE
jgi:hypothetical protein